MAKKLNDSHVHKMAADIPEFEVPNCMMNDDGVNRRHIVIIFARDINFKHFYIYSTNSQQRLLCKYPKRHKSRRAIANKLFQSRRYIQSRWN